MSLGSKIAWTEATWNPIAGCTPVSPGCLHCYAAVMANRQEAMEKKRAILSRSCPWPPRGLKDGKYQGLTVLRNGVRTFNGTVRCDEDALSIPLHWRKPRLIFVNSMSDLFHRDVPEAFVDRVFAVMALCPQHTFQVLTKRPKRMAEYLNQPERAQDNFQNHLGPIMNRLEGNPVSNPRYFSWPMPNLWLGASVEDEARNGRIDALRECPAVLRFLSLEPLLENLGELDLRGIGWVIVGGESGPGARPCNMKWIRSIVGQCERGGVPCFVKQLGANPWTRFEERKDEERPMMLRSLKGDDMFEWPEDLRVRQMPGGAA